jgi:DNA-binding NarL/FixJ family response regulator
MTSAPSPAAPADPGRPDVAAPLPAGLDRSESDVVLIVDDVPDNLAVLHDALDAAGFAVLVATRGEAALERAAAALPDIVLLDALMPGMDGFEVARRLKADPRTAAIPIVFMTGLTDTEHVVAALGAGGTDYITKPIRPAEVMARIHVHLQGARRARQTAQQAGQARNALDAFGYASITVRASDGRLMWQTALARDLLLRYYGSSGPLAPRPVVDWLRRHLADARRQIEPPRLSVEQAAAHGGVRRLTFRLHRQTDDGDEGAETGGGDWLIVMREESEQVAMEALSLAFGLTAREAEVLYWVAQGKTNRDIGDILGASPATAKKHLERIFAKLGVETRTAAAGMAMNRLRQG